MVNERRERTVLERERVNLENERERENRARQGGYKREERMKKISWVNAVDVMAVRLNDIGLILTV